MERGTLRRKGPIRLRSSRWVNGPGFTQISGNDLVQKPEVSQDRWGVWDNYNRVYRWIWVWFKGNEINLSKQRTCL